MNTDIKQLQALLEEKYQQWESNPLRMQSGYNYEKSFVEMWQQLGQQILQESVGELKKSRNLKKTTNHTGQDSSSDRTRIIKLRRNL